MVADRIILSVRRDAVRGDEGKEWSEKGDIGQGSAEVCGYNAFFL